MAYVYTMEHQTDFFAGFQPVEQFLEDVEAGPEIEGPTAARQVAEEWLERCHALLREHTAWRGDVRQDGQLRCEGVGAIPAYRRSHPYLVYIVKQNDHGTTFVVSDVPLPEAENGTYIPD